MKKTLTEEQKRQRRQRAKARREAKREAFQRKENRLRNLYIGKKLSNTDLELVNYPFYTTDMNSLVKLNVDDNNVVRSVKLIEM
jgi:hypothetical protein